MLCVLRQCERLALAAKRHRLRLQARMPNANNFSAWVVGVFPAAAGAGVGRGKLVVTHPAAVFRRLPMVCPIVFQPFGILPRYLLVNSFCHYIFSRGNGKGRSIFTFHLPCLSRFGGVSIQKLVQKENASNRLLNFTV